MKWMMSNGKITIVVGRVYEGLLQVLTKDGIVKYRLNTRFSLSCLKDVIVTGVIEDNEIDVKNIYPITDEMQMVFDEKENIRLFFTDEMKEELKAAGDYLYASCIIDNIRYRLRIIDSNKAPYNPSGYQVFITQKTIQENDGVVYMVQQIQ